MSKDLKNTTQIQDDDSDIDDLLDGKVTKLRYRNAQLNFIW